MQNFKVAVAQVSSSKGNIEANIDTHIKAIEAASKLGVAYIAFPELSLTGYEPELAANLAFSENDEHLQPLIECARSNKITISVGAPLLASDLPQIGLFTIFSTGAVQHYAKMHLHPGEEKYFAEGQRHNVLDLGGTKIANAICADTNHEIHAKTCAGLGADIYIAGVLITEEGYEADTNALSSYAIELNMLVAMANHNKPTGDWLPIGKSAIWSESGLLANADETQNALVVAEKLMNSWVGQVVEI